MNAGDKIVKRIRTISTFTFELLDSLGMAVVHHALVPSPHQPSHHITAHTSETYHADLHLDSPFNIYSVASAVISFAVPRETNNSDCSAAQLLASLILKVIAVYCLSQKVFLSHVNV